MDCMDKMDIRPQVQSVHPVHHVRRSTCSHRNKKDGPSQPPCALGPPGRCCVCAFLSPKTAPAPALPSVGVKLMANYSHRYCRQLCPPNLISTHYPHNFVRIRPKILELELILPG